MDGPPFAADSHQPALWHLDAARGPSTPSFDDLVGCNEQPVRHGQAKHAGGLNVNDQLELSRLHYGQISGRGALKDTADIDTGLTSCIRDACSVADQPACFRRQPLRINRWYGVACRQLG